MRLIPKLLALAVIGLVAVTSTQKLQAAVGLWDFNSSNLTATVGATLGDMTYVGATAASTTFSTTNINGTNAVVMGFPAATNGLGYNMPTPAANFGSTVNQYTFIADVFYPTASSGKIRPLIRTYALGLTEEFIVVDAAGAIAPRVVGPGGITAAGVGNLQPNTWYRLAISVTAGGTIRVYTNGVPVGSFTGGAVDGFFALDPNSTALVLTDTSTNGAAAAGFVNSIQIRDSALNAGQIAALGSASAPGIPLVIPPVPSFIDSRTPDVGQTGVSQVPAINIVLNQGDTVVTNATIQLKLNGAVVPATITPTPPTFTIAYTVPTRLDPLSVNTLNLIYSDSVLGQQTNTWQFTVKFYQVVTLPAPFFFENFDSLTEDPTPGVALPAGWTVANQTAPGTAGFNLNDRDSDSYKDWILVSSTRLPGWGTERTDLPTIILNGVALTSLTSGNLLWAESDARCGSCNGQYSDLFTGAISCVGRSNVFVAFNSIYEQNQDNMDFMEYSVDGGVSWLPVLYYFDNDPANSDIVMTNGVIDQVATFARVDVNRNWSPDTTPVHATNYGSYISAPISAVKKTDIAGRLNDDTFDGKRIEVVRLAAADNKPDVRFRLNANGTSAWFWGIDDFGLYEINTPVITGQPANLSVAAGTGGNFTVVASSPTALTYQWQHEGTNISNGGHYSGATNATLTVSNADPNDAGAYKVKVTNPSGFLFSSLATLTVVTIPVITTQPVGKVVSEGYPASFSAVGFGGLPLTYQWKQNGSPVGGNSNSYSLASAQVANAGDYTLVINNSYGSVTSRVARLSVSAAGISITNNLVAYLKFDGNASDSTGRGNNGTPVGAPTFATAGKFGNAMTFGSGQAVNTNYVTLGYPTDLMFGSNVDFSVSFWTKYSTQNSDPTFISNSDWDSSSNIGWGIFFQDGGNIRVKVTGTPRGSGNRVDTSTTPNIRDNAWHNVIVTYQRNGVMNTVVDGTLISSLALISTGSVDTDNAALGGSDVGPHVVNIGQDGAGDYSAGTGFNALMDDLGIWRRAISPQEALAIYNAGQAGQELSLVIAPGLLSTLVVTKSGGNVNFTWTGGTGIRLQKSTPSVTGTYLDIGSTLGNSSYSEAISAAPAFYRLYKP